VAEWQGRLDRVVLHPWVNRVANGAFLVGAIVFVAKVVIHALDHSDFGTVAAVALMVSGLVINRAQLGLARHVPSESESSGSDVRGADRQTALAKMIAESESDKVRHEPTPPQTPRTTSPPPKSPLREQLLKLLGQGEALQKRVPSPMTGVVGAAGGFMGAPTRQEDVDEWEARVEVALKDHPRLLARFKYEPQPVPLAALIQGSMAVSAFQSPLRRHLERRLNQLESIVRGL
jgi:hypothetical protein